MPVNFARVVQRQREVMEEIIEAAKAAKTPTPRKHRHRHAQRCHNKECRAPIVWYSYELAEKQSGFLDDRFKLCSTCAAKTFSKIHGPVAVGRPQ